MKINTTVIWLAVIALFVTANVYAAPGNIRFTKHNMSNNDNTATGLNQAQRRVFSLGQDQICIFCHTPHNAQPAAPLWNKVLPSQSFKFYSSGTLSSTARAASLPAGSTSLLCLSCHDGKTAINVLHNASNTATTAGSDKIVDIGGDYNNTDFGFPAAGGAGGAGLSLGIYGGFGTYGANLGGVAGNDFAGNNLTDDHPIGFSYTTVQGANPSKLNVLPPASPVRLFTVGAQTGRMECSSCHDPHVNYNVAGGGNTALKPFLVMSNVGSALCLACHNK